MPDENQDKSTQAEITYHVDHLEEDLPTPNLESGVVEPPRQIVQINLFDRLKNPRSVTSDDLAPKAHRSPIRSALDMFIPGKPKPPPPPPVVMPEPEPEPEAEPEPEPEPEVETEPRPMQPETPPPAPSMDVRPSATAPPPPPVPPPPPPPPPPKRASTTPGEIIGSAPEEIAKITLRRRLKLAGTICLALLLGGGGWYFLNSRSADQAAPVAQKESAKPTAKPTPSKPPAAKPGARPAPVTPPKPAAPRPAVPSYTVQTGDTLITIGDKLKKDWRAIAGANGNIRDPNLIYPGQVLRIP